MQKSCKCLLFQLTKLIQLSSSVIFLHIRPLSRCFIPFGALQRPSCTSSLQTFFCSPEASFSAELHLSQTQTFCLPGTLDIQVLPLFICNKITVTNHNVTITCCKLCLVVVSCRVTICPLISGHISSSVSCFF